MKGLIHLLIFIKTWIRKDEHRKEEIQKDSHKKEEILTENKDSKGFSKKEEILTDAHK